MKQNSHQQKTHSAISHLSRRSFLHDVGILTASGLLLDACKSQNEASLIATGTPIACYGDSLTDGFGGAKISALLATAFPGRVVENYGISGQTAQQIAARQGGQPLLLTLDGDAFAGTASVKVINLSARVLSTPDSNNTSTLTGTLGGIKCTLTRTATGVVPNQIETYTISPAVSTTQAITANTQFYLDSAEKTKSYIQTLWLGRNNLPNMTGVDALIDSCVAYLSSPRRFAVIGVLNAVGESTVTNNTILSMNALLAKNYPANFIPSTPPTVAEMAALNYTATAQDMNDIASGAIPRGMRYDGLHLNTTGYQLIANRIIILIKANNW
ncbi:hypothetical protein GO755_30690 [Spirosoma sp. HMF4905]|uniref:SGNH/GDSL hydrolase family protein n=1 Tax=Spirosoma arboris TaxID=2682092 RepID=A0A7K1SKV2_9BACT|nr:SGNH/GDSL hydrolase family protein [Spirosoma arboris]MVM34439.1 hypothetical protein [Spirosoma arboris]